MYGMRSAILTYSHLSILSDRLARIGGRPAPINIPFFWVSPDCQVCSVLNNRLLRIEAALGLSRLPPCASGGRSQLFSAPAESVSPTPARGKPRGTGPWRPAKTACGRHIECDQKLRANAR